MIRWHKLDVAVQPVPRMYEANVRVLNSRWCGVSFMSPHLSTNNLHTDTTHYAASNPTRKDCRSSCIPENHHDPETT